MAIGLRQDHVRGTRARLARTPRIGSDCHASEALAAGLVLLVSTSSSHLQTMARLMIRVVPAVLAGGSDNGMPLANVLDELFSPPSRRYLSRRRRLRSTEWAGDVNSQNPCFACRVRRTTSHHHPRRQLVPSAVLPPTA